MQFRRARVLGLLLAVMVLLVGCGGPGGPGSAVLQDLADSMPPYQEYQVVVLSQGGLEEGRFATTVEALSEGGLAISRRGDNSRYDATLDRSFRLLDSTLIFTDEAEVDVRGYNERVVGYDSAANKGISRFSLDGVE